MGMLSGSGFTKVALISEPNKDKIMYRGLIISSGFHVAIVMMSILALPFVAKKPIDIPPLISVELIQIAEKTNIPYAPKASKIIEKAKKENEKLLSEQAPQKK